jgi:hypothetical protein
MIGKIVGMSEVRQGDKSKSKGKPYHFRYMYFTFSKREVEGFATVKEFIDFLTIPHAIPLKVGETVRLDYDEDGRFEGIEVTPAPVSSQTGIKINPKAD